MCQSLVRKTFSLGIVLSAGVLGALESSAQTTKPLSIETALREYIARQERKAKANPPAPEAKASASSKR